MEHNTPDSTHNNQVDISGEPLRDFQSNHDKKGFSKQKIIIVIVGLVVLLAIGFGLALITSSGSEAPNKIPDQSSSNKQSPSSSSANDDVPAVQTTKKFKSDFPRIEFTYPENWNVKAERDEEGVRVESPEFDYQSINGNKIKGHFRIYIRQGARQVDSKYIGRGIASLPSQKLSYTEPPAGQRPETNLSFFGIDSSDHFAFFLIAGNFSLQKGESLGPEYGTEPETYIITGGYTTNELTDDLATNPVPLEYFGQTNAYKQAIEIIKSLKLL